MGRCSGSSVWLLQNPDDQLTQLTLSKTQNLRGTKTIVGESPSRDEKRYSRDHHFQRGFFTVLVASDLLLGLFFTLSLS